MPALAGRAMVADSSSSDLRPSSRALGASQVDGLAMGGLAQRDGAHALRRSRPQMTRGTKMRSNGRGGRPGRGDWLRNFATKCARTVGGGRPARGGSARRSHSGAMAADAPPDPLTPICRRRARPAPGLPQQPPGLGRRSMRSTRAVVPRSHRSALESIARGGHRVRADARVRLAAAGATSRVVNAVGSR